MFLVRYACANPAGRVLVTEDGQRPASLSRGQRVTYAGMGTPEELEGVTAADEQVLKSCLQSILLPDTPENRKLIEAEAQQERLDWAARTGPDGTLCGFRNHALLKCGKASDQ